MSEQLVPKPESKRLRKEVSAIRMFYWQWLRHTLAHWGLVSNVATAVGFAVPIISRVWPKAGALMGDLAWQIPVGIFAVLGFIRFLLAPYWMYREKEEQALAFELELEEHKRETDERKRTLEVKEGRGEDESKPEIKVVIGMAELAYTMGDTWIPDVGNNPLVRVRTGAIIANVSNAPAKVGHKTKKVYGLGASVTVSDEQGRLLGTVSRTYWLGNSANNLSLEAGEHRTLLVGTFLDKGYLGLHENTRTKAARFHSARQVVNNFPTAGASPIVVEVGAYVDVNVVIICNETGETMADEKARLVKNDEKGYGIRRVE